MMHDETGSHDSEKRANNRYQATASNLLTCIRVFTNRLSKLGIVGFTLVEAGLAYFFWIVADYWFQHSETLLSDFFIFAALCSILLAVAHASTKVFPRRKKIIAGVYILICLTILWEGNHVYHASSKKNYPTFRYSMEFSEFPETKLHLTNRLFVTEKFGERTPPGMMIVIPDNTNGMHEEIKITVQNISGVTAEDASFNLQAMENWNFGAGWERITPVNSPEDKRSAYRRAVAIVPIHSRDAIALPPLNFEPTNSSLIPMIYFQDQSKDSPVRGIHFQLCFWISVKDLFPGKVILKPVFLQWLTNVQSTNLTIPSDQLQFFHDAT